MKKGFFLLIFLVGIFGFGQETNSKDTLQVKEVLKGRLPSSINPDSISLDPLNLTAKPPFTAKNISSEELSEKNLGQDLPILLKNTPSVVTTSDAGAGVGYTSMRIRGSDQTRINVTLNGIPVNDSESHNVFWVNTPDLSSSTDQIIIQRGLGTSTNGTAAFGASVNIETAEPSKKSYVEAAMSAGSFNTNKHTLKAGSGTLWNHWSFEGRISHINSDGYVDRATSDLWSYNASVQYKNEKRKFWFTTFGGRERTYQSWFGIDQNTLETNRTFNPAGANFDNDGNIIDFYPDQVDDYHQDHYQLHYEENFGKWNLNAAIHYTYGRGFFEEYRNNELLTEYEIEPFNLNGQLIEEADLVRRQWLRNHFYGGIFNLKYTGGRTKLLFGGAINRYDGDHFGRVISVIGNPNHTENEYYFNVGLKDERSFYIKGIYDLGKWELFGDIQYRNIEYSTSADEDGLNPALEDFRILDESFHFLNPKVGVTYTNSFADFYFSYALGHREPNRSDFLDSGNNPRAETLHDFELGIRSNFNKKFIANLNLYYMYYQDQLVLTGALNDVGAPIRENSGESFRTGLELDATYNTTHWFSVFGNTSISMNQNIDWEETINDEQVGFGNTEIAFSPSFITNFGFNVQPFNNLTINLTNKFVGEQFMSNAEFEESKLDSFFVSDLLLLYEPKFNGLKNLRFSLLVNNLFDEEYENNGFYFNFFDGNTNDPRGLNHNPFFYPQAGINFLAGISVRL